MSLLQIRDFGSVLSVGLYPFMFLIYFLKKMIKNSEKYLKLKKFFTFAGNSEHAVYSVMIAYESKHKEHLSR